MRYTSPFAVITGASRGIGAEYARALASQGYDLLLIARDQHRLRLLANELHQKFSVTVRTECLDLAKPEAGTALYQLAQSSHSPVSLLINNAGFGMYGTFADMPFATIQDMLRVHIQVTTETTRLFLADMLRQHQGAIINVASIAGFFPIPYMAEYAATKAFIISFSEAVAMEARNKGVTIQVCCPGYTQTDFHETAKHHPRTFIPPQHPHDVVRISLNALQSQKILVAIGWSGIAAHWMARLLPTQWLMRMSSRFVRPTSSK
jgi:short-subunit dehydrogenase